MNISVPNAVLDALSEDLLSSLDISITRYGGDKKTEIDLSKFSSKELSRFEDAIKSVLTVRGAGTVARALMSWRTVLSGAGSSLKIQNLPQFCAALKEMLRRDVRHHLYAREDGGRGDAMLPVYVSKVEYVAEERSSSRGYSYPAYVRMRVVYKRLGVVKSGSYEFYIDDCRGVSVPEALSRKHLFLEDRGGVLRTDYVEELRKFEGLVGRIGLQVLTRGRGTDDLDGNTKNRNEGWWWSRTNTILLDREGEPSRAVIDVFQEQDKEDRRESDAHFDSRYWKYVKPTALRGDDGTENDGEEEGEEEDVVEIPVHPYLAVFDLRRHVRLQVHVSYVEEYTYKTGLDDCLVLPADIKSFVSLLLSARGDFRDIIDGKGSSSVVLCCGPAGCGKTLTAEVYSEARRRPLYSIQASQLGTDPDALEDELLKVFARASRWNAILLLDEADVYIRARGDDLQQNAIVGVFLRVLEYFRGVMFLTSNRGDVVDDAIASRCLARIEYEIPTAEDRVRIWSTLARVSGTPISDASIRAVASSGVTDSGRDVKMLLKLAGLVAVERGLSEVTPEVVEYVRRFKPTRNSGNES